MEKQIKTNYVYHPVYVDSTSRNTERKIINDVFDKIISNFTAYGIIQ